jgi:hypothetical protein
VIEVAEELRRAFVAAYRPRVVAGVEALGVEWSPALDEGVSEGERWLDSTLTELLSLPFAEQPRGPLEVFQEAMSFPTAALDGAGVPPAARDEAAVAALPGDRYDLAPASSTALGEEAWQIHMRWGATKAKAFLAGG